MYTSDTCICRRLATLCSTPGIWDRRHRGEISVSPHGAQNGSQNRAYIAPSANHDKLQGWQDAHGDDLFLEKDAPCYFAWGHRTAFFRDHDHLISRPLSCEYPQKAKDGAPQERRHSGYDQHVAIESTSDPLSQIATLET